MEIKEESRKNGAEMRSERSGDANDSETIDRNDASFQRVATQRVAAWRLRNATQIRRPTLVPPPRDRPRGSSESWNFVLGIGTFFGVGEEYLALKGSEAVTRCRDKLAVSTRRGLFDNCGKIF